MKVNTVMRLAIWFVVFLCVFNFGLHLINEASTIANIVGFLIIIFAGLITERTRFFNRFNFKKTKEEN